jgi:hypothetical protein
MDQFFATPMGRRELIVARSMQGLRLMRPFILVSLMFLSGCCLSEEEFSRKVEAAEACSPGDTCVLAGSAQCLCARPVNAAKAAEIDASAQDVCCGGAMVSCVAFKNPRCENGRCVADML